MIAIIDYGVGNLFSLRSSLTHLGLEAVVTADAQTIRKADRLILPGVGAFADAAAKAPPDRAGPGHPGGGRRRQAPHGHLPGDADGGGGVRPPCGRSGRCSFQ